MTALLSEAYEAIDKGALSPSHFKDFVFCNPARLHTGMNRNFFRGTRVELAVERHLAESSR